MRSERAIQPILMAQRAQIRPKSGQNQTKIRPERAKLRPRGGGRTDGRTEGRKDGRTEGRTSRNSPLCPTGHRPFGAAAQKVSKMLIFPLFYSITSTDRQTDRQTDWQTDKTSHRVACPQPIVAKALDSQRYPLPQYEWMCEGERGSGSEGADDLCLAS